MPQICYFYGISVYIQYMDHNPPHIHAIYNGFKATYDIKEAKILSGKMPNKANSLLEEWIGLRQKELLEDWKLASEGKQVFPISPLE